MRLPILLAPALMLTACAPIEGSTGAEASSSRQCFSPVGIRLVALGPDGAYLRARTGEAVLMSGDAGCLTAPGDPAITLRPLGDERSDVCLGDSARLDLRGQAVIERTCNVRLVRVVSEDEVRALPHREGP